MEQKNYETLLGLLMALNGKLDNLNSCPELRMYWIPKQEVKDFLGYEETQMAAIEKKYAISTTEIGKRKFYSTSSIRAIMDKNKK